MASHVPAWKRLGLKLKYANEEPQGAAISHKDKTLASTRVNHKSPEFDDRPAKRQRLDKSAGVNGVSPHDQAHAKAEPEPRARQNGSHRAEMEDASKSSKQTTKRRKSVAFTDDTKVDDGDSRVTIDFPAGSPGQTPKKAKTLDTDADQMDVTGSPSPTTTGDEESTTTKKIKKPKTGKKSKGKHQQKDKSSPALDYLHQHRYDHDSWKFNKNRDVWTLNRALDTDTIPNSHAMALAGYVRGLPGQAAARNRLVKECREALAEVRLDGDGRDQDRTRLMHLLENTSDEAEAELFLQSHSRPAILLWALGDSTEEEKSATPTISTASSVAPRKKKSRTSAPIDISSSSEDDSDDDSSDSSSDSDEPGDTKDKVNGGKAKVNGAKGKANGTATHVDDTSSSGSSSSSENDDSTSSDEASSDSD
ncbi:hypothetical protein PMZ80_005447 [Knufia obscura]|uniref:WKF domain-containing protein n=1 Tax=Knufia obscura TaxID=1635080 RepID=A0ABR0RQK8_9EURO|nr:hypothetical protein PMZ80_005447 [Knufia obscura]